MYLNVGLIQLYIFEFNYKVDNFIQYEVYCNLQKY